MTSDHPPLDDLDLSAVLDGDASDDVLARLEGDPAAVERLERLRATRDAVADASVQPLPGATVDALIARAIDAGGATADPSPARTDEGGAGGTAADDGIVAPLPSRRRKPVPTWAVAAVVVALVAIGLTLVWGGLDGGDDDVAFETIGASIVDDGARQGQEATSDAAGDSEANAPEGEPDGASAGSSHFEGDATTTAPAPGIDSSIPPVVALGDFADADALRVHLRDAFPTDSVEDDGSRADDVLAATARCTGKLDGLFGAGGEPSVVGSATVAGEAVVAYEVPFTTDQGRDTTLVMAVGEVTCIPVLSFQR